MRRQTMVFNQRDQVHGVQNEQNWSQHRTLRHTADHSLDAITRLLSAIVYALQRGIILLPWENPTYSYWAPIEAATRGLRRRNTVVGGKCALLCALLVFQSIRRGLE